MSGLFSQYRRQKFTSLTNPFRDVHAVWWGWDVMGGGFSKA
jgi:hypothetical protein